MDAPSLSNKNGSTLNVISNLIKLKKRLNLLTNLPECGNLQKWLKAAFINKNRNNSKSNHFPSIDLSIFPMISPLKNDILKTWFSNGFHISRYKHATISTMGSAPIKNGDLNRFLRANGLKIKPLSEDTNLLVIGHINFDEEAIKDLLDWREGEELRVYSQEMFLAHWMMGQDPFEDEEVVEAFAEDHKGLQFLKTCWVDWVSTTVSLNRGGSLQMDSPETSVLKELGYTVGKTKGLPASDRQRILEIAFTSDLNKLLSTQYLRRCKNYFPNYLDEWGEPASPQRLTKMRDFISSMCKQQKRRGNIEAATDYENDLNWIEMCLRTGRFKFKFHKAYVG